MGALDFRPGDWVLLWGQVQDTTTHPADITVEMFSHNAQFDVDVRRDRVVATPPPPFATQCPSLYLDPEVANLYLRCTLLTGHSEAHSRGSQNWNDLGERGRIEEA